MKQLTILLLFITSTLFSQSIESPTKLAIVREVHDGDSYGVRFLDRMDTTVYVRLHNVDCPEVIFYVTKDQPYARIAGQNIRDLIKGDTVKVTYVYKDVYKRLVCDVYKDSINLTDYIIQNGLGWALIDEVTPKDRRLELQAMQSKAKVSKLGLWSEKIRPLRPSTWRKKYSRF